MPPPKTPDSPTPFSLSIQLKTLGVFVFGIAALYGLSVALRSEGLFSGSKYFPFNVFGPRAQSAALLLSGVAVWLAGMGVLRLLSRRRFPAPVLCATAFALILASNFLQGVGPRRALDHGFAYPVSGVSRTGAQGIQYYHDARETVTTPPAFLRGFISIQPQLHDHGRTHPPGAVLFFWALTEATGDRPALTGVLIAALSTVLLFTGMVALTRSVLPATDTVYAALLLCVLPAAQIYLCATLDGIIAGLLLWTIALTCRKQTAYAALCAGAAFFLTFGAAWVVPVVAVVELRRKTGKRLALFAGLLIGAFVLLYALTGFNYIGALRTASRLENTHGFRLLHDPIGYAMTRLEDIAEILVFAGPLVVAALWKGATRLRRAAPDAFWLSASACATLLGLFLTGAYRTGETARACLFLYPFLLLPALATVGGKGNGEPGHAQKTLLYWAWTQTVFMQIVADYFW